MNKLQTNKRRVTGKPEKSPTPSKGMFYILYDGYGSYYRGESHRCGFLIDRLYWTSDIRKARRFRGIGQITDAISGFHNYQRYHSFTVKKKKDWLYYTTEKKFHKPSKKERWPYDSNNFTLLHLTESEVELFVKNKRLESKACKLLWLLQHPNYNPKSDCTIIDGITVYDEKSVNHMGLLKLNDPIIGKWLSKFSSPQSEYYCFYRDFKNIQNNNIESRVSQLEKVVTKLSKLVDITKLKENYYD